MDYLQTILLGIIQGLTEFLPISSYGLLQFAEHTLRIQGSTEFLNIALHAGTLITILLAMQKDVARLCREAVRMIRDIFFNFRIMIRAAKAQEEPRFIHIVTSNYRQLVVLVLCATIPTGAVGFLLRRVASVSYGQVMYSGIGMLLTGVLLLVADMVPAGNKIPKDITWKQGILIGIIQGISVISGISRMGLVLVCGILLGFNKRLAIRFSYLLSIPAILGAMITQVSKVPVILTTPRYAGTCLAGAVSAALVGFLSIRAISKFVRQRGLRLFAIWSFVLGIAIIAVSYVL